MKYTVFREYVSGRDGDSGFDDLSAAEQDFDEATRAANVASVELIDNTGDEPKVIRRHPES